MEINHARAAAILVLITLAIFVSVFATERWMTGRTGEIDTHSSITEPPK
ncbi:hypothetical protein [Neorhizobium sp. JUb45]|nr:hypothetical protein [Neorhizobium sp. JUb45]